MLDETVSVTLHRILSMARLLMHWHPRIGAEMYAIHLGEVRRFKVGWNETRMQGRESRYLFIGTSGGTTTRSRPTVPPTEINVLNEDLAPLPLTEAWRQLEALSAYIATRQSATLGQYALDTVGRIAAGGNLPLGPDSSVDASIADRLSALDGGLAKQELRKDLFADQLYALVVEYLEFRLTGPQAANILAVLLTQFVFRFRSPLSHLDRWTCALHQIDHLVTVIATEEETRWRCDLSSFYWNTYVALLYCEALVLLCDGLRNSGSPETSVSEVLSKRARYIDELSAWKLAPTLFQPQQRFPAGPAEKAHAQKPAPHTQFYPLAMVSARATDDSGFWTEVVDYSRSAVDSFSWTIERARALLCSELQEQLATFQVYLKLQNLSTPRKL